MSRFDLFPDDLMLRIFSRSTLEDAQALRDSSPRMQRVWNRYNLSIHLSQRIPFKFEHNDGVSQTFVLPPGRYIIADLSEYLHPVVHDRIWRDRFRCGQGLFRIPDKPPFVVVKCRLDLIGRLASRNVPIPSGFVGIIPISLCNDMAPHDAIIINSDTVFKIAKYVPFGLVMKWGSHNHVREEKLALRPYTSGSVRGFSPMDRILATM